MKASQTFDYKKNDNINRANIALICSKYLGIKEVSPCLYQIAAPVSELAYSDNDGEVIFSRDQIRDAIPWNERSLKTFGVVYRYESVASFIGIDGRTYAVPNDQPVLEHLKECGYIIAPYGSNLDGSQSEEDSLIFKEDIKYDSVLNDDSFLDDRIIDRNFPPEIINMINKIENNRPYYLGYQSYANVIRFGGTFGLLTASEEELQQLSLSERKIANITTYNRVMVPQNIEDYVQYALQQYYLNDQFKAKKI